VSDEREAVHQQSSQHRSHLLACGIINAPGRHVEAVGRHPVMFSVLRVQPLLGTFFTTEQNRPGADKVMVLTQPHWRSHYQERPEVIGSAVRLDDETYTVIGVAPRALEAFDARMTFVVPLSWPPAAESRKAATASASVVRPLEAGRHRRPGRCRGQSAGAAVR
jgi:hypothetical protein